MVLVNLLITPSHVWVGWPLTRLSPLGPVVLKYKIINSEFCQTYQNWVMSTISIGEMEKWLKIVRYCISSCNPLGKYEKNKLTEK